MRSPPSCGLGRSRRTHSQGLEGAADHRSRANPHHFPDPPSPDPSGPPNFWLSPACRSRRAGVRGRGRCPARTRVAGQASGSPGCGVVVRTRRRGRSQRTARKPGGPGRCGPCWRIRPLCALGRVHGLAASEDGRNPERVDDGSTGGRVRPPGAPLPAIHLRRGGPGVVVGGGHRGILVRDCS